MPQIGWLEILIVVVVAILIIGPKDFPIVLKKIGSWIGSFKNYFSEVQKGITDIEDKIEEEVSFEKDPSNKTDNKKNGLLLKECSFIRNRFGCYYFQITFKECFYLL